MVVEIYQIFKNGFFTSFEAVDKVPHELTSADKIKGRKELQV
jgi:hypothetical protein